MPPATQHVVFVTAVNRDVVSSQSSTLTSSNTVSPCVQLFPPLHGTDPASYTAPLIIPTLSGSSSEGSVATNPVTAASIAVITSVPQAELDVPEFEDDEQMFHYVVTRLQRALKDCQHTTGVSTPFHRDIYVIILSFSFGFHFTLNFVKSEILICNNFQDGVHLCHFEFLKFTVLVHFMIIFVG